MAETVVQGLSADASRIPSKWNRQTVADGDWLQKKTLAPLSARDVYLANAIDTSTQDWKNAVEAEETRATAAEQALDQKIEQETTNRITDVNDEETRATTEETRLDGLISDLRGDLTQEIADRVADVNEEETRAKNKENELANSIAAEETRAETVEQTLKDQIDALEAGKDVIAVYGSYADYLADRGSLHVTDKDIVKVLIDEEHDNKQTYYQYDSGTSSWSTDPIASMEPYYSVNEINTMLSTLTGDISNTYLSAKGAVHPGKNIVVTEDSTKPEITISTSADVEFTNVSSTNISATNVTALTANGNSAKFTNLSSTNLTSNNISSTKTTATTAYITNLSGASKSDTVDNLFGSAYSGAYASAWINDNKSKIAYTADFKGTNGVVTGYGTSAFAGGISSISAKTGNSTALFTGYNVNLQAGEGVGFNYGTNLLTISADGKTYANGNYIQISGNNNSINVTTPLVNSASSGYSAYDWITTKSATLSAGPGISFVSAGPNTLGISAAGANYIDGDYIHIDTSNNSINLSSNISANNISSQYFKQYSAAGQYTNFSVTSTELSANYLNMHEGTPSYGSELEFDSVNLSVKPAQAGVFLNTTWQKVVNVANGVFTNITAASLTTSSTNGSITAYTEITPGGVVINNRGTGGGSFVQISPTQLSIGNGAGTSADLANIVKAANHDGYISGDGTITALVSASQAGSTRGVLYFV